MKLERVGVGVGVAVLVTALVIVWLGIARFVLNGDRESLSLSVGLVVLLVLVLVVLVATAGRGARGGREAAFVPLLPLAWLDFGLGEFANAACSLVLVLGVLFLVAWALGRGFRRGYRGA